MQQQVFNDLEFFFVFFGLLLTLFYPNLIITADRSTRTLRLDYRYLLFHTSRFIPFDEIETIRAEKNTNTTKARTTTVYRIVATLKNGKTVPFRTSFASGTGKTRQQQAVHLNTFINHKATP